MTIEQWIAENVIMFLGIIMMLFVWEAVWKGIALYLSGKREQKAWFVFLLVINSMGILPIVYLVLNRDKPKEKIIENYKGVDGM